MDYSAEFERAKFRNIINDSDDIEQVKHMANILLDAYFDQKIASKDILSKLMLNAPIKVTPETLGEVAQDPGT
jgi:fructose-bisphosphate aldolase class 1